MPGRHCTGRRSTVVPGPPAAQDLPLLAFLSSGSQEEQGCHLPQAQPSSLLGPFPAHPAACRSWGRSPWPCWVAQAWSKREHAHSWDAEPSACSPAQLGDVGCSPPQPPPTACSPPRWPKRQSATPPATSEEKHPLYYRPQKRLWQCQEDQVYTGYFHFSARGREEGNKPN